MTLQELAADAAVHSSPQPQAARELSTLSRSALVGLQESSEQLTALEQHAEEITFQLDCSAITPGQARTELAQLETKANRLESEGLDSVRTSELSSGQAQARGEKKDQLARLEALFNRLEADTALRSSRQPQAARALSTVSRAALVGLQQSSEQLTALEQRAEEIAFQLDCSTITPGQARTELAQLETKANRLETEGLDAVRTSELQSGQAQAKSQKKDQLARLEALFNRLEGLFKRIKSLDSGG